MTASMTDIQIFSNPQFGEIRTLADEANEPMFCASDVCKALGYANPRDAISRHVDEGDVAKRDTPTTSGVQTMTFVNESGLYSLIFGSKLDSAKAFKKWVTSEVLPSIRRSGGYMVAKADETPEELMARCIVVANETINRRNERIKALEAENSSQSAMIAEQHKEIASLMEAVEEMKPKVSYYEAILASKELMTTTQIALDYGMSAQKLNNLLHQFGIQYKVKDQWILYSKYAQNGYVHSIPIEITRANGRRETKNNTQWRQKGRLFIYDTLKERGILPLIEQD